MPRPFTAAMLAQITGTYLRPVFFLQAHFLSGDIFLWSGIGTVTWNGQTWTGVGSLGQISALQETTDVKANNVTFTLSGIPSDLIGKALGETRQGYAVKLWFGALGDNNNVLSDPMQVFGGRMDVPTIEEGAETSTIAITVESLLVDLQRSRERRYTDQDQQIDYPGDLGFQYVPSLQNWNAVWGKNSGGAPGIAAGSGGAAAGSRPGTGTGRNKPGLP